MGYDEHKVLSKDTPVRCAVITVSDTRNEETDTSGALIKKILAEAGHTTTFYQIVPDEPDLITALLDRLSSEVEVVLLNGGTGISARDNTFEAVTSKLEKNLPGFGEIFRMLSYEEIGPGAMLSRATAGLFQDTLIFSMPGFNQRRQAGNGKTHRPRAVTSGMGDYSATLNPQPQTRDPKP